MKSPLLICLVFVFGSAVAQPAQKEINEQVWKPFISAYGDLNADAFMALHSKDLVRGIRDDGRVMGYDEYAKVISSGNHNTRVNNYQKKIELRFNERWINNDLAMESGIYKSQTTKPSGIVIVSHGRFLVILRREAGIWKILTDTDSSEGGSITEKEFLAARPME